MSAIRKRLINGIGANGFGQAINILVQLFSVPLYVGTWGIPLYGEWLLLSTLPAYLAMSDIGFASVAGNQMTMQVASGAHRRALATFQSAGLFMAVACTAVLGLSAASIWLPLSTWLNLTAITTEELTPILLIMALGVVVNLQMGLLCAGFRCAGHYALSIWIINVVRMGEFLVLAGALWLGASPLIVAAVTGLPRFLGYLIGRRLLRRRCPWLRFGYRHATYDEIKAMARPAFAFMAFPVGNALKNQGMLSIVGITLGPAATVTFSTLRTLVNAAQQAMGLINSAVWPEFSAAFGAGNLNLARKLHRLACKVSFWIALGAVLGLYYAGAWLLQVWTHGQVPFDKSFFSLLLLTMLINALWFTSSVVQAATNTHETLAMLFISVTAAATGLAYAIIPAFGMNGPALGLVMLESIMALYVLPASLSRVQDRGWGYVGYVLNPFSWIRAI